MGADVLEMDVLKVGIMALPLLDIGLNESDSASDLLICPNLDRTDKKIVQHFLNTQRIFMR